MRRSLLDRLRAALAPAYEVERELGAGGMATVFLARDVTLDRRVAVKVLRPELATASAAERFLREARLLASLSHPNVVPVHDAGEADGISYYVMDYVAGETLEERLTRGAMSKAEVVRLGRDLLAALETAHEHGVVHRDVKPGNVFLVGDRALLSDFGIAKPIDDPSADLTDSGYRVGTPAYMPPDQVDGDVTSRTDLYAVAMVLYEALTGRRWPVTASPDAADWSGVPGHIAGVLRRGLAWSPDERWPDAAAFRIALTRTTSWGARGPTIAKLAAVTALLLVGVMVLREIISNGGDPVSDLAIVPFEVVGTRQATFDGTGLAILVARILERVPPDRLTLTPTRRSFRRWETLQEKTDLTLPERAARAARMLGARYIAHATLVRTDDGLDVRLTVFDERGNPAPSPSAIGQGALGMQELADSIALRLLSVVLGHDLPNLDRLTRDVQALTQFLQGEEKYERGAWSPAVEYYEAAVARDSSFILAWWHLANAWRWLEQPGPYPEDFGRLYDEYGERLSLLDNRLMAAQLTSGEQRFQRYREVYKRYPQDDFAAYFYGEELFNRGPLWGRPLENAVEVLETAVALNPFLAPAYEHLAWANIRLARPGAARSALDGLEGIVAAPEDVRLYPPEYLGQAYAERFEPDQVEAGREIIKGKPLQDLLVSARLVASFDLPETQVALAGMLIERTAALPSLRAGGHVARGLGYAKLGRAALALFHFDSAAALFDTPEARLQAAEWRVLPRALGWPGVESAELERGRQMLQRVVEEDSFGTEPARAAWALAMDAYAAGDSVRARRWSLRLSQSSSDGEAAPLEIFLRAVEEAGRRRFEAALELSQPLLAYQASTELLRGSSSPSASLSDPFARSALHLMRGDWFERVGDAQAAEREWLWYEATDIDGLPSAEPAQAGEVDWALGTCGRFRRGVAALERGDREIACPHLSSVAELWSGADSATAELGRQAREGAERACG